MPCSWCDFYERIISNLKESIDKITLPTLIYHAIETILVNSKLDVHIKISKLWMQIFKSAPKTKGKRYFSLKIKAKNQISLRDQGLQNQSPKKNLWVHEQPLHPN